MLLSPSELESLVGARHRSPHSLLGLHRLGDGKGLVGRALVPGAARVSLVGAPGSGLGELALERVGDGPLFEGVTATARDVVPYELAIRWPDGSESRGADPYSFLPTLGDVDLHLFGEGNHRRLWEALGARLRTLDGVSGVSFAVWAPNARRVSVVGDFNAWDGRRHAMRQLGASGVWEIFVPGVAAGALYQFEMLDATGALALKTDPMGAFFEQAPKHAAIVWDDARTHLHDAAWVERRARTKALEAPMSVYEMHLGSWRKKGPGESYGYRDVAGPLVDYVRQMGFTHVEFLPLAEHAYYPSWGYQVTGFYAPTSRYGSPDELRHLVDVLHDAGIGVLVDWVPAHFPRDDWALARFDGTALYEHEDPRKGAHQDWGTLIFNYGRHEVRNFLVANALAWCERFHVDGLRVDAVASMLYLDYSRKAGEWIPNAFGGRENLEAVAFLREVNEVVPSSYPGVVTIAEESTSWPMVSRPAHLGGLGFTMKWNMGWMHDTLSYFGRDPVHRKHHQNELTFAMLYHSHESFVLPLSHDEVVHGKGSLRRRMPGDDWQGFANLRALFAYQWAFPGKKLLFMGGELGQTAEWSADGAIDEWLLGEGPYHAGVRRLVADLNKLYRASPALYRGDYHPEGFRWIDCSDTPASVISFERRDPASGEVAVVVMNLTPVTRTGYRVGVPAPGEWREALNSDAAIYGGSNAGNGGSVFAEAHPWHGQPWSASLTLPPLGVLVLAPA